MNHRHLMKKITVTLLVCIIVMLTGCDQPRDIDRAVAHAYKQCVICSSKSWKSL